MANIAQKKEHEHVRLISGLDIEAHVTRVISIGKARLHWHKELELVQALDGPVIMHLEEESVLLGQDDFFIVNANELHCFQKTGTANDILILQIPLKHFQAYYPQITSFKFYDRHIKKSDHTLFMQIAGLVSGIFHSLAQKREGYQLEVMGLTNLLMERVVHSLGYETISEERRITNSKNLERLNRIINLIDDGYAYGLSLEEIARKENLSKYYLSHFIKKYLGLSFRQYVRRLRLEKAVELLLGTEKSKLEICMESGFSDYRYLCGAFAEEFGCTPAAFREKHQAFKIPDETFSDQYIIMGEDESYKIYFRYLENADYIRTNKSPHNKKEDNIN